tara:strand:+ start:765 stop:1535 length:771 start_codon:yes stop_codon:yes gene_type:complete
MNENKKKPHNADLTIESVQSLLSKNEKAEFFDVFWKAWSANGFGTLAKKDTELLLFGCLKKSLGKHAPTSNHEWARFLRLTPGRVRTVLLESHLRFSHLLDKDESQGVSDKFLAQLDSVDIGDFSKAGGLSSVKVLFLVEDPVMQMEIDKKIREIGGYINYLRNREVIVLRLLDFFRILSPEIKEQSIKKWVAKTAQESKEEDALQNRVRAKEFLNLSGKEQLIEFADDLASLSGVKVLANRLKLILAGNAERSKR